MATIVKTPPKSLGQRPLATARSRQDQPDVVAGRRGPQADTGPGIEQLTALARKCCNPRPCCVALRWALSPRRPLLNARVAGQSFCGGTPGCWLLGCCCRQPGPGPWLSRASTQPRGRRPLPRQGRGLCHRLAYRRDRRHRRLRQLGLRRRCRLRCQCQCQCQNERLRPQQRRRQRRLRRSRCLPRRLRRPVRRLLHRRGRCFA